MIVFPYNILQRSNNSIILKIHEISFRYTQNIHDMAIKPKKGKYVITVVDEKGNEIKRNMEIL